MNSIESTVNYVVSPSLPEEFYRVGDDGSVWSCQRRGRGAGKKGKWRRIKDHPKGIGYRKIRVSINGMVLEPYLHRLVLETFVGPCPEGMETCHEDGNRANNALYNLKWGTRQDNVKDKFRHGTQLMGSRIPWAKLTEEDIILIRERITNGDSVSSIAKDYRVDPETIRGIKHGRTWKHVISVK